MARGPWLDQERVRRTDLVGEGLDESAFPAHVLQGAVLVRDGYAESPESQPGPSEDVVEEFSKKKGGLNTILAKFEDRYKIRNRSTRVSEAKKKRCIEKTFTINYDKVPREQLCKLIYSIERTYPVFTASRITFTRNAKSKQEEWKATVILAWRVPHPPKKTK